MKLEYERIDYEAITYKLTEISDYPYKNHKEWYWGYDHLYNELAGEAVDLLEEAQTLYYNIENRLSWNIRFGEGRLSWWDAFACFISQESFEYFCDEDPTIYDIEKEDKAKNRIENQLIRLKKDDYRYLSQAVFEFIVRYLYLVKAFDVLNSIEQELEYNNSFLRERDDDTIRLFKESEQPKLPLEISDAIEKLDEVIPSPENKMVDSEHLFIAQAWKTIREQLLQPTSVNQGE